MISLSGKLAKIIVNVLIFHGRLANPSNVYPVHA